VVARRRRRRRRRRQLDSFKTRTPHTQDVGKKKAPAGGTSTTRWLEGP